MKNICQNFLILFQLGLPLVTRAQLWGSSADMNALDNKFLAVKNWSDQNNIPVILGEFGSLRICDYNSRMKHYAAYVELSQKYGFASCALDDGGDFRIMERESRKWDEEKDILIYTTALSPRNIKMIRIYNITGSPVYTLPEPGIRATVSTQGLPHGIYIIKVMTQNSDFSAKIILP